MILPYCRAACAYEDELHGNWRGLLADQSGRHPRQASNFMQAFSVLASGMYQECRKFAWRSGLPAKSGVERTAIVAMNADMKMRRCRLWQISPRWQLAVQYT